MIDLNSLILIASVLILVSAIVARLVDNIGIPTLILFLGIGMIANNEKIIEFGYHTPQLTHSIATIALIFIIFSGGLDTSWEQTKSIVRHGVTLATIGVIITALAVALFTTLFLGYSLMEGMLLGSIISSTDAPAVFSILRSKKISLKGTLKPLLEFESGSNDPTALFLTVSMISFLSTGTFSLGTMFFQFILQMTIGAIAGILIGKGIVLLLNHIHFSYEGFYPVTLLACITGLYAGTTLLNGNGILAVYIAGIVIGNSDVVQRRSLLRFFDGFAWLSQITMFVALGFLVTPSEIFAHAREGFIISAGLIFLARPIGVFISLLFSKFSLRERLFISWVGIRGSMPIILTTFLVISQIPNSYTIIRIVFFIVLTSALIQGWSIPYVARLLRVDAPLPPLRRLPLEFETPKGSDTELYDFIIPYNSPAANKPIVELGLPKDCLIVLIIRNERYILPSGSTALEPGDTILALVNKNHLDEFRSIIASNTNPVHSDML